MSLDAGKIFKSVLLAATMACPVYGVIDIRVLPNEVTPKQVILENDSLYMEIHVNWTPVISSLKYKPTGVELVQVDRPIPLFGADNRWTLFNVGSELKEVEIRRSEEKVGVTIHAYSRYLENAYRVTVKLDLGSDSEIEVDIQIEDQLEPGHHDLYRENNPPKLPGVIPGLPWLAFLEPNKGEERQVLYPKMDGYELITVNRQFMDDYRPVNEGERPLEPDPVQMQFNGKQGDPSDPLVPTIVHFPASNLSALLYREKSDIPWRFATVEEALWPSGKFFIPQGEAKTIFTGTLRVFEGGWQNGFAWFKENWRRNFDFSTYERPGHEKFDNMFLGVWSFVYDRNIYDAESNKWTIDEYLGKAKKEYDGFDQYVFWHSYNRVGTDLRDQFDLLQDLPGGIDGVKDFISTANSLGTKVYLPYNPWDKIKKRENMYRRQAEDLGAVNADGLFLDTMGGGDKSFRQEVNKFDPSAQFLSEFRPNLESLQFTTAHYNENFNVRPAHMVELLRFALPEHKIYKIERVHRDRKNLIYNSFFNAIGYAVWDDVFGEVNMHTWDEKILISRFNRTMHDFPHVLSTQKNMPLVPTYHKELYVNGFFSDDMQLFTLLYPNRERIQRFLDNRPIGAMFDLEVPDGWHMVDVWNKRPVDIKQVNGKKVAFLRDELADKAACFVAMPELIKVTKLNTGWTATVPGANAGTLELVGVDNTLRNREGPEVAATETLHFDDQTVEYSTDGYVMIQYRNVNREVRDVALIKVAY
jgi:hypothetical protein